VFVLVAFSLISIFMCVCLVFFLCFAFTLTVITSGPLDLFMVHLTVLSTAQSAQYQVGGQLANGESEGMWKEVVVAKFEVQFAYRE
jgi:hypothetical protein